jgi:hypothetical protein
MAQEAVKPLVRVEWTSAKWATISFLGLSPDGKTLLYSVNGIDRKGEGARSIVVFDLRSKKEVRRISTAQAICAAAYLPDGESVVLAPSPGRLSLWDTKTYTERHAFDGSDWTFAPIIVSPDGKLLATSQAFTRKDGSWGYKLRVWDIATGKQLCAFGEKEGSGQAYFFDREGKFLAVEHRREICIIPAHHLLPSTVQYSVHLWEARTGKDLGRLREKLWEQIGVAPPTQGLLGEIGALSEGFSVRRAPGGKILLFPTFRPFTLTKERSTMTLRETTTERGLFCWDVGALDPPLTFSRDLKVLGALECTECEKQSRSNVVAWDVSPCLERAQSLVPRLLRSECKKLYEQMGTKNMAVGYKAMGKLLGSPKSTLKMLQDELKPAPPDSDALIRRLIKQLDDEEFKVRESAQNELIEIGGEYMDQLQAARDDEKTSEEARRRLKQVLERLPEGPPESVIRNLWGIEILEQIGTPTAIETLSSIADGNPNSYITREAKASLQRLAK